MVEIMSKYHAICTQFLYSPNFTFAEYVLDYKNLKDRVSGFAHFSNPPVFCLTNEGSPMK